MILNDAEIKKLCVAYPHRDDRMISPFIAHQVKSVPYGHLDAIERVISYGLSSFGYDIRVKDRFMLFQPSGAAAWVVDPKNFEESLLVETSGMGFVVIPPNSFVLAESVERFVMPPDVMGICVGKSTYARCGIIVNVTPLEPGWEGVLTIEISNTTPLPAKVYANEGLAQIVFFRGDRPTITYADRAGKYQGATEAEGPKT